MQNTEAGDHLDFVAWNYVENVKREETEIAGITHEQGPSESRSGDVWSLYGPLLLPYCYSRPSNGTHLQLSGSGRQVGSLPPCCLEAPTQGGVAQLDPHTGGSGWGSPDLIMWMPSPCWGMPCTPPLGTQRCWPGPMTMSTTRAERWGTYRWEGRSQ